MKITKFVHSCLLVEMPEPVNRTILIDPGLFSEDAIDIDNFVYLDNIVITHKHADHFSLTLIKKLVAKFPNVRITTTREVAALLKDNHIDAVTEDTPGIELFNSPHESVMPLLEQPEQIGVHVLDLLTHPGDGHSFDVTKSVLALPVTAPWGSTIRAVQLALELRPQYIVPIHDWHYRDEAREQAYNSLEELFASENIIFLKLETGKSVVLNV